MKKPPAHTGKLSHRALLIGASTLLNDEKLRTNDSLFVESGALTVLTGSNLHHRMRFVAGLVRAHPGDSLHQIYWFSRYWTVHEVIKTLIKAQLSQSYLRTAVTRDAIAQAIEQTELLNLHFETSQRSITEVVGHIEQQVKMHTPRLIVVDGLEHYRASPSEYRPPEAIPDSLALLKDLAANFEIPVLITCLPPPADWSNAAVEAADQVIALS